LAITPRAIPTTLADLRQAATANRPDVVAAQCTVEASRRTLDLACAQRSRDVNVTGAYQCIGATIR